MSPHRSEGPESPPVGQVCSGVQSLAGGARPGSGHLERASLDSDIERNARANIELVPGSLNEQKMTIDKYGDLTLGLQVDNVDGTGNS